MTKPEIEILEIKELIEPQYAPIINRKSQLEALIRIQIPINRVTVQEVEESSLEPKDEKGAKTRMTGKKEIERQKEEQAENRREKRALYKDERKKTMMVRAESEVEARNNRTEKRLEDYDVTQLEPYDGTRFIKELGDHGFYDIKKDLIHKKVVTYDISNLEGNQCLVHYRSAHIVRRPISIIIKERFKVFEEILHHVNLQKEREVHQIYTDYSPIDIDKETSLQSKILQEKLVKEMVIDKKETPIYDFECDHDADENYWCTLY